MMPSWTSVYQSLYAVVEQQYHPMWFCMSERTYNRIAGIRTSHRRAKRRARYNRGKLGVRPRKRGGR